MLQTNGNPGLVRFSTVRQPISKYSTTRLVSRSSLSAARRAIPTRPGEGESPNSIYRYSPFVRHMSSWRLQVLPPILPIDTLLPEIVASLRQVPNLVIEAAPGAGKTTRVPPALLALGGEVLVLEPRRIAARMARSEERRV